LSLMDKYKMRHQPPLFQPKKLHPHGRRMTRGNTKLLLGLLWMPEILLNDYPPDIPEEAWPDERAVETSSGLSRHRDRGRGARHCHSVVFGGSRKRAGRDPRGLGAIDLRYSMIRLTAFNRRCAESPRARSCLARSRVSLWQAGQILPTDASPFRDRSRTGPSCVARRASKIDERVHYGAQACDLRLAS